MKRSLILSLLIIPFAMFLAGCQSDADVASYNLSKAADNFEIERRIVFINGITDKYLLVIEGRCALGNDDSPKQRTVTCKVGKDKYKKHFLGLSDNVTYLAEQLEAESVSTYRYRVVYKPTTIIPDIDLRIGGADDKAKQEVDESKANNSPSDAAIVEEATREAKGDNAREAAQKALNP